MDNTAGANGSAKRRKQVYWGKTRINQWLFTKSKDGHKQHNGSRPTKIIITSRDDHQQYQQLPPARTIRIVKDDNKNEPFILQIPLSPSQGKPPATKTGRPIQPNNQMKVLTANVQSLSPKIDELIALIQGENFDVIALNETPARHQKQASACKTAIHSYKVFHVGKPTPTIRGGGSIMYMKKPWTQ